MAVKVTGQFIPAGDFSIIDGKDVSGNITGSNFSGSLTSTGSFGRVEATSISGDGSGLSNVFEGTAPSSSISTRLTNLTSDSASFSTRVTDLKTDSGSFSTRVTDLKTDSGSFSTRVTNLKTDSGSFSTRVTNLKTDSGSFSTRVTKNEGTGSKILAGELEFTNITASNNARIDGNLTVAGDYTVSGDTTFVSSSTLIIGDNIIEVNAVNPVRYGGIYVKDVDNEQTGSLIWDSTNDYWVAGQSGSEFRIPLQNSTSNLTDNKIVIAQSNGRIESGNITDDGTSVTIPLPITASSHISSSGNIIGTNLVADSASVSTRLTTEESNIDALQTDSGSFSTRVTDLKTDSGSFSTRITNLKSDSGSFSTRITNLKSDSGSFSTRTTDLEVASASFSTRITTAETELEETIISASAQLAEEISGSFTAPSASLSTRITNLKTDSASFSSRITTAEEELELTLISGSAQLATQISGAFESVSSSLSDRLQTAEIELEETLISGSAQLANQISGAFTSGFEFNGTISGSSTSTGSFGHVMQDGKGLPPQFTTGSSIFIGENAGASDDGSNNRNIGIGKNALDAATTGHLNIAIGDDALTDVTTGNHNVAIGFESQKDTTGGNNTSIGYNSLEFNTSGNNNVAIGYAAAGGFTYSGISNIAIGFSALGGNSVSGDYNIAIGHVALNSNTAADDNMAIGDYALTSAGTDANSSRNIAIGSEALRYVVYTAGSSGFNNTVLGWNAGTRFGDNAGNLTSASYGVYIGHTTYPLENNSYNEILIGSQVRGKGSNTATIGDGNITDIYLSQDQGATVHTGNVSGSSTSTGSFGRVEVTSGKILGDSTSAVSVPFSIVGGTSAAAGGLQFGAYNADFGGIWPAGVTPAASNYAFVARNGRTVLNTTTDIGLYKDDASVLLFANSTGVAIGGDSLNPGYKLDVIGTGRFTGNLTLGGNVVGDDATNISGVNNITALGDISGSATSTGSFGSVETVGDITATGGNIKTQNSNRLQAFRTAAQYLEMYSDPNGFNYIQPYGGALRFAPNGGTKLIMHTNGHFGINTTTDAGYWLDVNGTARFTGTLTTGIINSSDIVSASSFNGIFNGALSGSAQIASNISGAFAVASASFAADILSNSSSFAARDTLSEATSSKILNGQLEFTNITGSGHVSMSLSSTGSFGRVSATTIGGHSPLIVDSNTTFTNSITGSGHVSASLTSTASFGNMTVKSISGHESLLINTKVTASSAVQFDGKVFFETGSIEGDLHIRTNENLMRLGKSTTGVIVSGSSNVSRFATGSDGSIIDLGFTIVDEDGDTVLAGDGDGIHVDSNNYWYNNKFYRVGDARNDFLVYDAEKIKYSGEVIAQTGSINGELHIVSPTGSMFIGKFTGGIPSSGSDNISRFATGSDGSVIDLGFTTTDEDGNTVFLTTGDGIVVDSTNYWYTTGHFKIGDSDNFINWNTNNLNISGTFVGDGSGLTGIGAATVPAGTVSSSLQLATSISGSFTSVSASLAGRITDGGITLPTNTLTSSAQISTQISGAFTQPSSSISTRITTLEANPVFSSAGISGSFQILSQSLANRLTVGGLSLPTNTISSSAQLSSNISGSFTSLSQSFANRLTVGGLSLPTNTVSSSAQLSTSISGSFTSVSASLAARLTLEEAEGGGGSVPTGTVSGSAQLAVSISGSFVQPSSSFSTRVTNLKADSGSFSTRVTNLKADSGSFSTRVTNLKSDSGSFSTRVTTNSSSFATRITNFSTGNVELISGSATSTGSFGRLAISDLNIIDNNAFSIGLQSGVKRIDSAGGGTDVYRFIDASDNITGIRIASANVSDKLFLKTDGSVSGSAVSTGSFGQLILPQTGKLILDSNGGTFLYEKNNNDVRMVVGETESAIFLAAGAGVPSTQKLYLDGGGNTHLRESSADNIKVSAGGVDILDITTTSISGSATSTGSFGLLQGDGSELTGVTATLPSGVISGSSAGLTILGDGKVGINNATPQLKLDVSNGASGIAAHFGGNVSTSNGVVGGISFGYYESNNANYRKAGIIQEQIGDSHARGDLHLIVNTQGGQLSATAADARLTIDGLTGDVLFPGANQKISGSLTSTGSFGNIQTPLEGRVISNFTELIKVTVVSDGGNHYAFEGATAPSIQVSEGKTYRFDISDSTVGAHPFRLSTTEDGSHGGGSAYTTGVTVVGTQGQAGAYLEIKVDKNTANALYYYCTAHPGMGNDGRLLKNDLMNLAAIKVTGNQVDFTNLPTSNPNVAGRLWNDSGTVKISSG